MKCKPEIRLVGCSLLLCIFCFYNASGEVVARVVMAEVASEQNSAFLSQQETEQDETEAEDVQTVVCELPEVRDELVKRVKIDQELRMKMISQSGGQEQQAAARKRVVEVDKQNTAWLKQQVAKHGWLGKTLVGTEGAHNAWLLVQHADKSPKFQELCLDKMSKMPKGEIEPKEMAYLTDRVLTAAGKPQRYGTQCTIVNGKAKVKTVEDPESLDQRRATVGLGPMDEYLKIVESVYSGQDAGK